MNPENNKFEYFSVIGYGTFITRGHWKDKHNVEPCLVNNFSRVYPQGFWFPIVFPSGDSFWALKFEVTLQELEFLDNYEHACYAQHQNARELAGNILRSLDKQKNN